MFFLVPENGSFTGLIGHLVKQEVDYILSPNIQYIDHENKIDFSSVVGAEDVVVGHFLDGQQARVAARSEALLSAAQIFIPSLNIFLVLSLLFLLIWLLSLTLFLAIRVLNRTNRIVSLKIVNLNLLFLRNDLNHKLVPVYLKYALLFNLVVLSFVKIILTNNIQSSKVVVDKETLLFAENKIYTTKMRCCWLAKDNLYNFFQNSRKGIGHFIYRSKTDQINPCILMNEDNSFSWEDNFFSVGLAYQIKTYLRIIGFAQRRSVFINKNPLFNLNAVIYLSVSASRAIRDAMENWIVKFSEHGWYNQLMRKNFEMTKTDIPKEDIYSSASEYTDRNTIIKVHLDYDNFELFFHTLWLVDAVLASICLLFKCAVRIYRLKAKAF